MKKLLKDLLIELNLVENEKQAIGLILAGKVLVDDQVVDKIGSTVAQDSSIRIQEYRKYVSRAGDKLEAALQHFKVSSRDRIAIDIGASTGGFSDCLLKAGVAKIYAVDVGANELDYSLSQNSRLINIPGFNARNIQDLVPKIINVLPNLAVVDVSFISAILVLQPLLKVLEHPFDILILVKPQFELPVAAVKEGGLVDDPNLERQACAKIMTWGQEQKLRVDGPFLSPVPGKKAGNREYFVHMSYL